MSCIYPVFASSGDQTRASMDLLDSGSSNMFLVKVIFSDKVLVEKKHGNGSWCCGVVVKEALSNGSSPTTSNNQTPTQSYSLEMSGGLDIIGSNSTGSFEANAWRFGLQAAKFTLPGPVTAWALLPDEACRCKQEFTIVHLCTSCTSCLHLPLQQSV